MVEKMKEIEGNNLVSPMSSLNNSFTYHTHTHTLRTISVTHLTALPLWRVHEERMHKEHECNKNMHRTTHIVCVNYANKYARNCKLPNSWSEHYRS